MIYDFAGNKVNDDSTPINKPLDGSLPDLSNETVSPTMVSGGKAKNYQTGVSGWIINPDGSFEFGSGSFRGTISIGPTASVYIDGVNGRFVLNDGVTNRAVWGNV